MDFKVRVVDSDERTGAFRLALTPDPRRYEWIERNGERALFDRLENAVIPEHVLDSALARVSGIPLTFAPPRIDSTRDYVRGRRPSIAASLLATTPRAGSSDIAVERLASLAEHELEFTVLSIDLVGSTRLATTLPTATYAQMIDVYVTEAANMVALFRGHVLKFTGDGLLAFFPGLGPNTQNDLGIDCALSLTTLVDDGLNPELERVGLPALRVRLGLDHGQAAVRVLGSPATKRHADLIGEVVNLACKVQGLAAPGGVCIGGVAERALHVRWREQLEPVQLPPSWAFSDEHGRPYPVFRWRHAPNPSSSATDDLEAAGTAPALIQEFAPTEHQATFGR